MMKTAEFHWDLKRLHPRVDVKLLDNGNIDVLDVHFNYPYRYEFNYLHRHYRMPIWFHFSFYRNAFEKKFTDILEKNGTPSV